MSEPIEKDLISAIAQTESEEVEARAIEADVELSIKQTAMASSINKGVSDDIKL